MLHPALPSPNRTVQSKLLIWWSCGVSHRPLPGFLTGCLLLEKQVANAHSWEQALSLRDQADMDVSLSKVWNKHECFFFTKCWFSCRNQHKPFHRLLSEPSAFKKSSYALFLWHYSFNLFTKQQFKTSTICSDHRFSTRRITVRYWIKGQYNATTYKKLL